MFKATGMREDSEPRTVATGRSSSPAGAAEPALPGRRRSPPSGGSAAHEVASVGAIIRTQMF